MNYTLPSADVISESRIRDTQNFAAVFEVDDVPLTSLIAHYVHGTGSLSDHLMYRARFFIDQRARADGVIGANESVFDRFNRIVPDLLQRFCPDAVGAYFDVGPDAWVTTIPVFGPSENTWRQPELPRRLSLTIHKRDRPAFAIYQARGVDVFVRPYGHQIYSKQHGLFWPSGGSRPFTRAIMEAPEQWIPGHVVVVQDRFDCGNFAHFLFDYVTRIGHFAEAGLEEMRKCYFILNGIPGRFQALLLEALSATYNIPPDRFVFPQGERNLRADGHIYWFSDATQMYVHPAQMAHPRSIEIIRKVSAHLDVAPASGTDSLYISRRDADRRRVANEGDLWPLLEQRGFQLVTLAEHSIETQIALVRGAKRIIAPHGMGMTHVSLHLGSPAVLELFNVECGGDAFAYMARGMGFDYNFVAGPPNSDHFDDFTVSTEALRAYVNEARLPELLDSDRRRNVVPASESFGERWSSGAQPALAAPSDAVPPLFPDSIVLRHVRAASSEQPDSNCGSWWDLPVDPDRYFTASCFVWIPGEFVGRGVLVTIGEWDGQKWHPANLSTRDQWQRISATAKVPSAATSCAAVLRVDAEAGAVVYSTAWQVESGPLPTSYQATP